MRFHIVCRPQIRIVSVLSLRHVDRDKLVPHADVLRGSSRVPVPLRTSAWEARDQWSVGCLF